MSNLLTSGFLLLFLFPGDGPLNGQSTAMSGTGPISHHDWSMVLNEFVSETGEVDYRSLLRDRSTFHRYLDLLQKNHPNESWSREERLAYWINAYNAFTVDLILEYYPVSSIKDIRRGIPFVNTVWDIRFINIGGQKYSLNQIEHRILRKQFDEPRIHFAINCASVSCPKLLNEAYQAEMLDEQLSNATRVFLADRAKNDIRTDEVRISKIFSWFEKDFRHKYQSLIQFLNLYAPLKIAANAQIRFLEYNWSLNDLAQ